MAGEGAGEPQGPGSRLKAPVSGCGAGGQGKRETEKGARGLCLLCENPPTTVYFLGYVHVLL